MGVLYGAAMKLSVLSVLLARLVEPAFESAWVARGVGLGLVLVIAALVGVVESTTARVRLARIPTLIAGATLVTAFGFLLVVR